MAYGVGWDETAPDGSSVAANTLDTELKNLKISIRERLEDVFPGWTNDSEDPKVPIIGGIRAKVELTADELIVHNTPTIVPWDQTVYETDGDLWDIASAANLVVQDAGFYMVNANIHWETDGGTTGYRLVNMISVVKSVIAGDVRGAGADAAGQSYQNITWIGELTAGDVIYILVTQTSGGNLDIQSADSYFSITRLG